MRIALVPRRFPPLIGGAEAMLRYLAIALADEGAEVTVVTSRLGGFAAEERIGGKVRVVRLATSPARLASPIDSRSCQGSRTSSGADLSSREMALSILAALPPVFWAVAIRCARMFLSGSAS